MTSDPEIRAARREDAEGLARLFTSLGHPTSGSEVEARWERWREAGNEALVAVGPDGTVLGAATLHRMIVLHRPRPVGRITALAVDAPVPGQGIGRALVAAAESKLLREGCGLVEITSNFRFEEAHAFYEHLGYDQTSYRFAKVLDRPDEGS